MRSAVPSSGHGHSEMQAQKRADIRQNFLTNWMLTESGAKATDACHFFVSRGIAASPVAYLDHHYSDLVQ